MTNNFRPYFNIGKPERNQLNGHKSFIVWFVGLSGSGKSTLANAVERVLFEKGIRTYILDGDIIRTGLNAGLTFSEAGRTENLRRIAEVGKLFVDAGMVTLAAFITPLETHREMVQKCIGNENYIEIFVNTPIEVCEKRDIKGLYRKARLGEIPHFTGVSAPFETPKNPDIEITEKETIEEAAERIVMFLNSKLKL